MDSNEYTGSFLFMSPSSSSRCFISNTAKLKFVIAKKNGVSHLKFLESSVPWEKILIFLSPLGFDIQTNSDHKTQKIKLYSVRALKRYLNEKNLIHGRAVSMISKFSPQIFETYFGKKNLGDRQWIIVLTINYCFIVLSFVSIWGQATMF